jgi:hypothetical protein
LADCFTAAPDCLAGAYSSTVGQRNVAVWAANIISKVLLPALEAQKAGL